MEIYLEESSVQYQSQAQDYIILDRSQKVECAVTIEAPCEETLGAT